MLISSLRLAEVASFECASVSACVVVLFRVVDTVNAWSRPVRYMVVVRVLV